MNKGLSVFTKKSRSPEDRDFFLTRQSILTLGVLLSLITNKDRYYTRKIILK
jgi:hypothetical protein